MSSEKKTMTYRKKGHTITRIEPNEKYIINIWNLNWMSIKKVKSGSKKTPKKHLIVLGKEKHRQIKQEITKFYLSTFLREIR